MTVYNTKHKGKRITQYNTCLSGNLPLHPDKKFFLVLQISNSNSEAVVKLSIYNDQYGAQRFCVRQSFRGTQANLLDVLCDLWASGV
jgi:hypothetical protein